MLLLIYDKAVLSLQEGIRLLQQNQESGLSFVRLQVQRTMLLIVDGLNMESCETSDQIMNLCLFVMNQTQSDSEESWTAALQVIQTLRDGFVQIQDDAREAEYSGRIPALNVVGL